MLPGSFPFPQSALYCAESADDVAMWDDAVDETCLSPSTQVLQIQTDNSQCAPDDRFRPPISKLLESEQDHCPLPDFLSRLRDRTLDPTARQDAISWILKVHGFYRFRPVTAYLAVNYLDRFLSVNDLPLESGAWPWQLLSVACLSVAAKMEETHVPLLLDLQVMDPRYVFEPRTVRRMELLLMASLRWRMRSVTPFDFLDHFADVLSSGGPCVPLFSRAADLILRTHRVVDFLHYKPSAISAAAVLCAAREIGADLPAEDSCGFSDIYESISKEVVNSCHLLMEEYLIDTCPSASRLKPGTAHLDPASPQSPVGVLDAAACGSCDSNRSTLVALLGPTPEPPSDEPLDRSKRRRIGGGAGCTGSINTVEGGKGHQTSRDFEENL